MGRALTRRAVIAATSAGLLSAARGQDASSYPTRRVRFIVPYPPGATTDLLARLIGQKLERDWRRPVGVENIGGAGGITGTSAAARAEPDGHTIVLVASSHVILPSLMTSVPYDPVKDFAPVTKLAAAPSIIIASNGFQARTFAEFVALARTKEVKYGSSGIGTVNHIGMEQFRDLAGLRLSHVSYKGGSAAMNDILGGHLDITVGALSGSHAFVTDGRARALAITSERRHPLLPDVPTLMESGFPLQWAEWFGILAPAGTPAPIVEKIGQGVARAMADPEVVAKLPASTIETTTPAALATFMAAEARRWADVSQKAGIRVE